MSAEVVLECPWCHADLFQIGCFQEETISKRTILMADGTGFVRDEPTEEWEPNEYRLCCGNCNETLPEEMWTAILDRVKD